MLTEYQEEIKFREGEDDFESRYFTRKELTKKYAWSILDRKALYIIFGFVAGDKILSVGSGTGYNEMLLSEIGADIIATDADPPSAGGNYYGHTHEWVPVKKMGAIEAIEAYPDRKALFLSWPSYDKNWATEAVKAFKGNKIVFIGEGWGGCTADDEFFDLWKDWEVEDFSIPQWDSLHDRLYLLRK